MMIAPTGIVLGPKRLVVWWTRLLDWLEIRYSPSIVARRQQMFVKLSEATRLQRWVDQHFP